jgi:peptidoglycan/xylan/chitin deacetylase (PgdA/CDA1 family)
VFLFIRNLEESEEEEENKHHFIDSIKSNFIHRVIVFLFPFFFLLYFESNRRLCTHMEFFLFGMQNYLIAVVVVILLCLFSGIFPPRRILRKLAQDHGVLFYFRHGKKRVSITIDDAPSPYTEKILDVLRKHRIKATFFVIGDRISGNERVLKAIWEGGHEIGNHDTTTRISAYVPTDRLLSDVINTQQTINLTIQRRDPKIKWFRPGSGLYTMDMVRKLRAIGYTTVLGDVYAWDAMIPFSWWTTIHALFRVREGSILIMHDGSSRAVSGTASTLDRIIPQLQRRGYSFATLTEAYEKAIEFPPETKRKEKKSTDDKEKKKE